MSETQEPRRGTRRQVAEFLTANGYPLTKSVLDKLSMASVGRGPPVAYFWGNRPIYDFDEAIRWAESRRGAAPSSQLPRARNA